MSSSPCLHAARAGWNPKASTLSPAVATVVVTPPETAEPATSSSPGDYFTYKPPRHLAFASTSSASSLVPSLSSSHASALSPGSSSRSATYIAYPSWPAGPSLASCSKLMAAPPTALPSAYISDADLEGLDFSPAARRSAIAPGFQDEMALAAVETGMAITWSATRQLGGMRQEERRRRLPPPPPGMLVSGSSRARKTSRTRRGGKGLGAIRE